MVKKRKTNPKIDRLLYRALGGIRKKLIDDTPTTLTLIKEEQKKKNKIPTKKEIDKWANQKVIINCTMHEAGDLMDLLFMADGGPFDGYFSDTIKLNKMTKSYNHWLNKMVDIVCKEDLKKDGKSFRIQQNKK